MNHDIEESVCIRVSVTCASCKRQRGEKAELPGEALRTGNITQRAVYWLDQMDARLLNELKSRTWDKTEQGWRCAHCRAADIDRLARVKDPKEAGSLADVKQAKQAQPG